MPSRYISPDEKLARAEERIEKLEKALEAIAEGREDARRIAREALGKQEAKGESDGNA